MEKRAMSLKSMLFIATGLVVIVCMFLNWFPVNLDLGLIQIGDALGKINALNFHMRLGELEKDLGEWSSILPKAFDDLKTWTLVLTVGAVLTVAAYIYAIILHILKKEKCMDVVSGVAAIGAIASSYFFCSLIKNIENLLGIAGTGYSSLENVTRGPCLVVMLAALASVCCTEIVADTITEVVGSVVSAVVRFVFFVISWIEVILNNIGYVVSDVIGGIAGIFAGAWIFAVSDFILIAVIGGIAIAGVVAMLCMSIVHGVFMKNKESIFK